MGAPRDARSGAPAALLGLVLSALGVVVRFPQLLGLIPSLQQALNQ